MSHDTHMNESCHTSMSRDTRIYGSWHESMSHGTYEGVAAHI